MMHRTALLKSIQVIIFLLCLLIAYTVEGRVVSAQSSMGRLKILLLGDSYTAGNGARKSFNRTDYYGPDQCYRSHSNWGEKYAKALESQGYAVTLVNRACSGAVTNDILYENDFEQDFEKAISLDSIGAVSGNSDETLKSKLLTKGYCDPREAEEERYRINVIQKTDTIVRFECRRYIRAQLDHIDNSFDLVLMTLGGNDVKFAEIVSKCFLKVPAVVNVGGCSERVNGSKDITRVNTEEGKVFRSNLESVFTQMRSKLRSDAKVVLLGYPHLAKDDNYKLYDFLNLSMYEASKDIRLLGELGDQMHRSVIPTQSSSKANFYYFDEVKAHFAGHEPDMSDPVFNNPGRWMNTFNNRIPAEWFHFNPKGHEEVAKVLSERLTQKTGILPGRTANDYDVVFIFNESYDADRYKKDDTTTKSSVISSLHYKITQKSNTARFAIIKYNTWLGRVGWTESKIQLLSNFPTDGGQLTLALRSISQDSHGNTSPGALKDALNMAMGLKWRPGVKKLVYIIGKTRLDDTALDQKLTYGPIVQKALAIDPVAIIPLRAATDVAEPDPNATYLAEATGGITVQSTTLQNYNLSTVISQMNGFANDTPYAWAGEGMNARIGEKITLDGSGSYDSSGIILYEWDTNGDGVYEISSESSTSDYMYMYQYGGLVTLRVTNAQSKQALATFPITVTSDGDQVSDTEDNCPGDWNEDQSDADSDGLGDVCDTTPGIEGYEPMSLQAEDTSEVQSAPELKSESIESDAVSNRAETVSVNSGNAMRDGLAGGEFIPPLARDIVSTPGQTTSVASVTPFQLTAEAGSYGYSVDQNQEPKSWWVAGVSAVVGLIGAVLVARLIFRRVSNKKV